MQNKVSRFVDLIRSKRREKTSGQFINSLQHLQKGLLFNVPKNYLTREKWL
ncbi:MAG: hypothetical protein ACR2MD_14765 [Aridibacter sp.]